MDPTLEGEVLGELLLRKSDTAVGAASRASCFEGEGRMLLPDTLRGDFEGEAGAGILIESNIAANAAFSGDIGLALLGCLRSGEWSIESIVTLEASGLSAACDSATMDAVSAVSSDEPKTAASESIGVDCISDPSGLTGNGTEAASQ